MSCIHSYVNACKTCLTHKPSKSEAGQRVLSIPIDDLSPMDWISTDLMEIKDAKGKKMHFIVIVDRSLGFISAYKLTGTKTKHIVQALQEFVFCYYGPPLYLISDGGPQFQAANKTIIGVGAWHGNLYGTFCCILPH